ncbi:AAA family ATPase [Enhygromyxa salina]|uniref:Recombination protein F n=1 Tax=Enhygromyxa salina TaxID=215803 RepID=A0A2S9XUB0_9BACT|nr:recombination protein F [Enhygromyxa salina]
MRIERLSVRNFRVFRSVDIHEIPSLAFFVGANGTGKSTLLDVFGFLRDALQDNVHVAMTRRGGFNEVVSRGEPGPLRFEIAFRDDNGPLVTYTLEVGVRNGRGVVEREVLAYQHGQHGQPWHLLDFRLGEGTAVTNEVEYGTDAEIRREEQRLDSPEILAIKGLGQFQRFAGVSSVRRLIERWHLSDFQIQAARPSQEGGYAEHLSAAGDNLPLVTQFLYENHRDQFDRILERMKKCVPGVSEVEATETIDGRLVLRFQDGSFKDPFIARYVSDGTIKMFAYLVLLNDPSPHPLLCIEEPENQIYPTLLAELAEEFRDYGRRGGQVMVSTHSPDLLNAAQIHEVYWLEKHGGFTTVRRACDDEQLRAFVDGGDQLGALWKQGLFGGAHP